MKNIRLVILLAVVAAAGFWGYRTFFPSDEVVIRKLLVRAAEMASIRAADSGMKKLASVNWLMNACTTDVELALDAPGIEARSIQGRDQLGELLGAVKGMVQSLSIELMDIRVQVDEDKSGATAQFVARANAEGVEDQIIQEFRVRLRRVDGDWKLQRIEPLESLRR